LASIDGGGVFGTLAPFRADDPARQHTLAPPF